MFGVSRFSDPEHVTCEKKCLEMVETHAEPSPMVARFALLADGEANRKVS